MAVIDAVRSLLGREHTVDPLYECRHCGTTLDPTALDRTGSRDGEPETAPCPVCDRDAVVRFDIR